MHRAYDGAGLAQRVGRRVGLEGVDDCRQPGEHGGERLPELFRRESSARRKPAEQHDDLGRVRGAHC